MHNVTGYAVTVSNAVVGSMHESGYRDGWAEVRPGGDFWSRREGRIGKDVFTERAEAVAEVDRRLVKRRADLRRQLARLEELTGEAVVAGAEAKAKRADAVD